MLFQSILSFLFLRLLWISCSVDKTIAGDRTHNESCYAHTQCPGQNMLCKVEPGSINLCVCELGYTFSHVFARCEPSKNIFRSFRIEGPTRINMTNGNIYFHVKFTNSSDELENKWKYEWLILDGHQFSTFSHLNESTLELSNLKPGFILFGISIVNDDAFGYILHNLTILDLNHKPIANVDNLTLFIHSETASTVLNGSESKNAVHFKWTPWESTPACLIIGKSLSDSKLYINKLIPGHFLFNLTVYNEDKTLEHTTVSELRIINGVAEENSLELLVQTNQQYFTYSQQRLLEYFIKQIFDVEQINATINFTRIAKTPNDLLTQLVFYAYDPNSEVIDAREILRILRGNNKLMRKFKISSINTLDCLFSCSGHGICNNITRYCVCESLWIPNLFKLLLNEGSPMDCSWPIIVILLPILFVLLLTVKIIQITWTIKEKEFIIHSEIINKLLLENENGNRKYLMGRFSPFKMLHCDKRIYKNSVTTILKDFDENLHKYSSKRGDDVNDEKNNRSSYESQY